MEKPALYSFVKGKSAPFLQKKGEKRSGGEGNQGKASASTPQVDHYYRISFWRRKKALSAAEEKKGRGISVFRREVRTRDHLKVSFPQERAAMPDESLETSEQRPIHFPSETAEEKSQSRCRVR